MSRLAALILTHNRGGPHLFKEMTGEADSTLRDEQQRGVVVHNANNHTNSQVGIVLGWSKLGSPDCCVGPVILR